MNIEEYQQQFLQLLHTRVVTFHYRKKNRSLRKAIGTTCLDLIPTDSLPKGIGAPAPKGQVRYYDFTVSGWRTLRLAHVTSYSLPQPLRKEGSHEASDTTGKGNQNYQLSIINYKR